MSTNSRSEVVGPNTERRINGLPRVLIPAGFLVVALSAASPSLARSNFDGDWSVVIETRGGACMPTLRYPVAISDGIVANGGETPATIQGRVAPNGAVRVTVQSGGSWASGSGRLTTTSGSGV
jgi:hypothetical protein